MKNLVIKSFILLGIELIISQNIILGQENKLLTDSNFYSKSLHYTNRGIEYIYSKEQGGLERLTGMTASEIGCLLPKCHITSCDVCHKEEATGIIKYSKEAARSPKICHPCHGELEKDNPDVHFTKGMKCMDCHTAREMHGDGKAYNTYMEPGVFDVKCEKCHSSLKPSVNHTIHKEKLDCTPCHADDYYTCLNCHIDTRLKEKKDVQVLTSGMFFLINHEQKVTLGNMLTYVYKNETMITFAPLFPHSIKREGRKCNECHNSKIVNEIKRSQFTLTEWQNGNIKNAQGVIPVFDPLKWGMIFLDRKDSVWIPIENPAEPLLNYSGYCSSISLEQFNKLQKLH